MQICLINSPYYYQGDASNGASPFLLSKISRAAPKRTTGLSQPDDQAAHVAHFTATAYTLVHYLMTRPF